MVVEVDLSPIKREILTCIKYYNLFMNGDLAVKMNGKSEKMVIFDY
jgi:hypothetical protein